MRHIGTRRVPFCDSQTTITLRSDALTRYSVVREAIHACGVDLFRAACDRDLEGIGAKWASGTYRTDGRATSWLKIKNREYSQTRDRHELFASRQAGMHRGRAPRRPDLVMA